MGGKMDIWKPKHFKIEELVPPNLFEQYRDQQWKLWMMLDDRPLKSADFLREQYGPCTINNWLWGGSFVASGLRTAGSAHYSPSSQHSWGRALDLKFKDVDAETVREYIIETNGLNGLITRTEAKVDWNHIDSGLYKKDGTLWVFNP